MLEFIVISSSILTMNSYFIIKCIISGLIVGVISEVARRSPAVAAITASLPLVSILAIVWLYRDTGDVKSIIALSNGIAIVVVPSLAFFIILSLLLKQGWSFYLSLFSSCGTMAIIYAGYVWVINRFGFKL